MSLKKVKIDLILPSAPAISVSNKFIDALQIEYKKFMDEGGMEQQDLIRAVIAVQVWASIALQDLYNTISDEQELSDSEHSSEQVEVEEEQQYYAAPKTKLENN